MHRAYASGMSAEQERSADARTDVTNERTNADPRSPSEDTSPLVTRGRTYGDESDSPKSPRHGTCRCKPSPDPAARAAEVRQAIKEARA